MTFITPKELSDRYRGKITMRTLANWRSKGEGPKFTKAGGRVLYSVNEVEQWERVRTIGVRRG